MNIRKSQMEAMADASPGTQMVLPCKEDATWIEVRLVDRQQKPVAGERYRIRLPDSSLREGTLDNDGRVRFDNIVGGQAEITFPNLDKRDWKPAEGAAPGGSGSGGSGDSGSGNSLG
jgi:hypothetical protein